MTAAEDILGAFDKPAAEHPLVSAAKAYMVGATAYDAHCDAPRPGGQKSIFQLATDAGVVCVRQSRTPPFLELQDNVKLADTEAKAGGPVGIKTLQALVSTAARMKRVGSNPKSAAFQAAQRHYVGLGYAFGGPRDVPRLMGDFINQAERVDAQIQEAVKSVGKAFDEFGSAFDAFGMRDPFGGSAPSRGGFQSPGTRSKDYNS